MKKILLIILLFILTGCTVIQYSYYPKPLNNINADYKEYVYISTYLEKSLDEKSLIEHISVYDKRNSGMNKHYVKILSPTVKVIYNNKEYIVNVDRKYRYTISLLEQNIKINNDFSMYIGKVELIFGRNWNGKQLDQIEKEYKGIFNNGMIAHSQGTIIYASKLRDDLETEEGRWNFNSQQR